MHEDRPQLDGRSPAAAARYRPAEEYQMWRKLQIVSRRGLYIDPGGFLLNIMISSQAGDIEWVKSEKNIGK